MNKLHILFGTALLALGISSCDMEKYPYDAIEEGKYMIKASDFAGERLSLYSPYRSVTTGAYLLTSEFQAEDFYATSGFSNTYGSMYRWDFQSSEGNIEGIWQNYYVMIARSNYFIDSYNKLKEQPESEISADDMAKIAAYTGEAYFNRAYAYVQLACHFCKAYNPSTAETDLGLPLQLTYAPTSDASKYPGRSSMKATFEQIMSDITNAKNLINPSLILSKSQNPIYYISADVVTALEARAALQMKDYDKAIKASTSLITSQKYPLINTVEDFTNMFVKDDGSEVIWKIYMSADEKGSTTGTSFWGQYNADASKQIMDYQPSRALIDLYDEDDIRFNTFFKEFTLSVASGAKGKIYVFNKFPGNPDLYSTMNTDYHYMNMSKPFRIAEQYLIAAEAYLGKNNDLTNSAKYLNDLKGARIANYTAKTYTSANVLLADIQDERHRELVGEGFRLTDLKRWGLGVNRGNAPQNADLVLMPGGNNTTALEKAADDYRMVWPIPKTEIDVNPQIKNQQNPGY